MKRLGGRLAVVLVASLFLASARSVGADTNFNDVIRDWSSLHLQETQSIEGARLSAGHARFDLLTGEAAYVVAGGETVGIYFRGEGRIEYVSTDPVERPAVLWKVRQSTGLKPEVTTGSLTLRDRFTEVLWLSGGEALPALRGRGSSRALDEPFARHREEYGRRRSMRIEEWFAVWRLNDPGRRPAFAEVSGGDVPLLYVFDDSPDGDEGLYALRGKPAKDSAAAGEEDPIVLSGVPIGRSRRDATTPRVFMSHVDLAVTETGDANVTISATETFHAMSTEVRLLWLSLYNERRLREGFEMKRLSFPLRLRGVYDEEGKPVAFRHARDSVLVGLETPLKPGTPRTLRFEMEGPILYRLGGDNYWALDDEEWFPQPSWGAKHYTVRAVVRVKQPFTPLASGTTIRRIVDGDFNVLETRSDKPIRGLIVLAGKLFLTEERVGRTTIRLASYGQSKPVGAAKFMKLVGGLVEYYEGFLGPFPFEELNVVGVPTTPHHQSSGPGFLLVSQALLGPGFGGETIQFRRGVGFRVAQLVATQYWGQAVKAASWAEGWVTAAFAEMCAALAIRDLQRPAAFEEIRKEWRSEARKATDLAPIPLASRLRGTEFHTQEGDLYYSKGAWILDTIRQEVGERPFLVFLASCQSTSLWKLSRAETVQAVIEAVTKRPWGAFFDTYYWGTAMPGEPGQPPPQREVERVVVPATQQPSAGGAGPIRESDVEVILRRLLELKDAGFDEELLLAWLRKNRPQRSLTAEEMIGWKKAGVPPNVIREVMK